MKVKLTTDISNLKFFKVGETFNARVHEKHVYIDISTIQGRHNWFLVLPGEYETVEE